jgi:CDP-diglyceride synthetase
MAPQVDGPMQLHLIIKFVLLLAIANGTPVMAEKLLGRFLSYPLDAGKTFIDGRRLFGCSKTIRGIVVAVMATSACAPVLGVTWPTGSLIGVAAMAGDLISSFIKRRMGRPPSSRALGLDQIPESLLPALACKSLLALTVADVIVVVALFSVAELILSRLLFKMHIRKEPY